MFRLRNYIANRKFTLEEHKSISTMLNEFVENWAAHGNKLKAGYVIFDNQIIQIYVDQNYEMASGCSLDKATKIIQEIDSKFSLDLFDRTRTAIVNQESIIQITNFKEVEKIKKSITTDFVVFEHWKEYSSELLMPISA